MTETSSKSMNVIHEIIKPTEFLCWQCGYKPKECLAFGQQCTICKKCIILQKSVTAKARSLPKVNKLLTVKVLHKREFTFLIRKTAFSSRRWTTSFVQCYTGSWCFSARPHGFQQFLQKVERLHLNWTQELKQLFFHWKYISVGAINQPLSTQQ